MADTTIVNTSARRADSGIDSAVGWVVAAIVLIAVIVGAMILLRNATGATDTPGANIEVSLPSGSGTGTGAGSASY